MSKFCKLTGKSSMHVNRLSHERKYVTRRHPVILKPNLMTVHILKTVKVRGRILKTIYKYGKDKNTMPEKFIAFYTSYKGYLTDYAHALYKKCMLSIK